MKIPIHRHGFLLLYALVLLPSFLQADDDDDGPRFVANEIVVKLNPAGGADIGTIHADYGTATVSTMLESAGIYLVSPPAGVDLEDLVDQLEDDLRLLYAEPNYIASVPQSDGHVIWAWSGGSPVFGTFPEELVGQPPIQSLDLPSVRIESTGTGVVVAVLDTGVDQAHPNLAASLLGTGYDFVDDDAVPQDQLMNRDADGDGKRDENFGHGTHVAGAVLLSAPDVSILPIRVLDSEGRGNTFILAEAIDYAVRAGAYIINLSLGMEVDSDLLEEAVERAHEAGVLVVAAAGNANSDQPRFPAALDDVLGVASVDADDRKSVFSNWGSWIDVSAPGEALVSAFPGSTYAAWSGTSMAAPLAAGQAALLKAIAPDLETDEVIDIITRTAFAIDSLNPDWEQKLGAGRIDLLAAVQAALATLPGGADDDEDLEDRYGTWTAGTLAELAGLLESGQDDDFTVRTTGTLGQPVGGPSGDDADYLFSDDSGVTVVLDLDSRADLRFALTPGLQLEIIGELEREADDGDLPAGILYELEAVWIRLAGGAALDIGPMTALAGSTISDWIGYFWKVHDDGWYYHSSKGYLFSGVPFGDDGWFLSLNREDWIYVSRLWYPFIYSNSGGWHYLIGSPYGGIQHAYRYNGEEWLLDFWGLDR